MSQIEQTRRELKELLAKIPGSGSFEGARLATQVSQLAVKYADLVSRSPSEGLMETAPTPGPDKKSGSIS
jgi:hypothetical protein